MAKLLDKKEKPNKKRRVRIAIIAGAAVVVLVALFLIIRPPSKGTMAPYNVDPEMNRQNEIKVLEKVRDDAVERARAAGRPAAEIEELKARFQKEIDKLSKR